MFLQIINSWKNFTKFYIDTVITVKKIKAWETREHKKNWDKQNMRKWFKEYVKSIKDKEYSYDEEYFDDVLWNDHFSAPFRGQHNNKKLYTVIGDKEESYVPLDRVSLFPIQITKDDSIDSKIFEHLRALLNKKDMGYCYTSNEDNKNWNQYPVCLTTKEHSSEKNLILAEVKKKIESAIKLKELRKSKKELASTWPRKNEDELVDFQLNIIYLRYASPYHK